MIQSRYPIFPILVTGLLLCMLTACADPEAQMPDKVAAEFWLAVARDDEAAVRLHVTAGSQELVDLNGNHWGGLKASFGEVRIRNDEAMVETILLMPGQPDAIHVKTVLLKERGQWRVDYPATVDLLPMGNHPQGALRRWQALGERFSDEIGRTMEDIEKEIPRVQESLEQFGDSMQQDIEKGWQQEAPRIREQLDQFMGEFEKAIDEAAEELKRRKQEIYPDEKEKQAPPQGQPRNYI